MTVSPEDRDAMLRLRSIMEGHTTSLSESRTNLNPQSPTVELAGPGQVTSADVSAMASVLTRLNNISNHVVDNMMTESAEYRDTAEALVTERTSDGVKVGRYEIIIRDDAMRLAGKQFYSIHNSLTRDTIADDISLYETALAVIRLLNSGKFVNDIEVRTLFEHDDAYTSHRVDAITYKRRLKQTTDKIKKQLYESRLQASMDRCMTAKRAIKMIAKQ